MSDTPGAPARDRLLQAADDLFYSEGVQTVGVDRIAKQAGASKKSLYALFGSKEALILAYLQERRASIQERILEQLNGFRDPAERILGIFELQGAFFADPRYNGCPLLAASTEAAHGSPIAQAYSDYRTWIRTLLTGLAAQAGLPDPDAAGRELHLLYDAAAVAARADRDGTAAATARNAAVALLDQHRLRHRA